MTVFGVKENKLGKLWHCHAEVSKRNNRQKSPMLVKNGVHVLKTDARGCNFIANCVVFVLVQSVVAFDAQSLTNAFCVQLAARL